MFSFLIKPRDTSRFLKKYRYTNWSDPTIMAAFGRLVSRLATIQINPATPLRNSIAVNGSSVSMIHDQEH